MTRLRSQVNVASPAFVANRERMLQALREIERLQATLPDGGGAKYVQRHRQRGKLLVRERIGLLIDEGSALLELSPLAGWGTRDALGGGLVTAVAVVEGVECVVVANDPTVRGGSLNPTAVRRYVRALEVARDNRLPLITLTESAGADLTQQADIFVPGGAIFRDISRLSAQGVPTIGVVFGSATAGGAYIPAMCEYTVLVKGQAKVFLGGPPLVKMAIGETVDDEDLGGAEMHARISGVADYLAHNEHDALRIARSIVKRCRDVRAPGITAVGSPPLFDPEELLGIPSMEANTSYDMREILARIVDGSEFDEFKPEYGANLVCGWAMLHDIPIGVLANNGVLFSPEAQKGAHFIQLNNRLETPLLFMHNITGFMVGVDAERHGIIKDGSKMINAVSNSAVPHLALMVGASYGAGNYAMSGRAYAPRFVFSWPSHRIAVMGPKQIGGVMSLVRRTAAEKAGVPFDEQADAEQRQTLEKSLENESSALFATGRLWDDGIIDPRDSRIVLGIALSAATGSFGGSPKDYAVFRM